MGQSAYWYVTPASNNLVVAAAIFVVDRRHETLAEK
jgi:hypothetical protein